MENEELCALARAGDQSARERLLEQNRPFVYRTAKTLLDQEHKLNHCLGLELDDLAQVGYMRLDHCVDLYNPDRGIKFITYAAQAVRNGMLDYIEKQNRTIAKKKPVAPAKPKQTASSSRRARPDLDFLSTSEVEAILQMVTPRDRQYLSYRWGLDQDRKGRSLKDTAEHFYLSLHRAKETEEEAYAHLEALLRQKP